MPNMAEKVNDSPNGGLQSRSQQLADRSVAEEGPQPHPKYKRGWRRLVRNFTPSQVITKAPGLAPH